MPESVITAPWHTQDAFDPNTMPDIVTWAAEAIRQCDADAIMACGHSGLTIAGAVSFLLRIPVIAVRKEGEDTVAGSPRCSAVLRKGPAQRWVWLDDFLSSGGTFARSAVAAHAAGLVESPVPHATVLYHAFKSSDPNRPRHSAVGDMLDRVYGYGSKYKEIEVPEYGRKS